MKCLSHLVVCLSVLWKLPGCGNWGRRNQPNPTHTAQLHLFFLSYTGNCKRDFIWKIGSPSKMSLKTSYLVQSLVLLLRQAKSDISISRRSLRALPKMDFISSKTCLLSGKTCKATRIGPCANLTWKKSEQHYWPWKFWQHATLIFCFIMSNLRICHWCTQLLTHFSTPHCPSEPPLQLWLWQTQNTHHPSHNKRWIGKSRWWWLMRFPSCHQLAFLGLENCASSSLKCKIDWMLVLRYVFWAGKERVWENQ